MNDISLEQLLQGMKQGGPIKGEGGGMDDMVEAVVDGVIPAKLSADEHVFDAEFVAMLGDGSSDMGHKILEELKTEVRKMKENSSEEGEQSLSMKDLLKGLSNIVNKGEENE